MCVCVCECSATYSVGPEFVWVISNTMSMDILRSQVVTSKQPKLGLTQELFFSRIRESTIGYTFTPCVGYFTYPSIDTR